MTVSCPSTTLYPSILSVPPIDRRLRGREKVLALSRHARHALRMSCDRSNLELDRLPKSEQGVPLPVNGIHWSLSHKPAIVGGVAALLPVGLDIETIRPVKDGLLAKVADDDEWQLVGGRSPSDFFRFWTAKEAVLKAVGKGMAGLSRCRIVAVTDNIHMTLTYENAPWPVEHCWFGSHVAAITTHDWKVCWSI